MIAPRLAGRRSIPRWWMLRVGARDIDVELIGPPLPDSLPRVAKRRLVELAERLPGVPVGILHGRVGDRTTQFRVGRADVIGRHGRSFRSSRDRRSAGALNQRFAA